MVQPKRRKNDDKVTTAFCKRFGVVAIQRGFVTMDMVKAAIAEQVDDDADGREHRLIGTILFEKGWITEDQIDRVLKELRSAMT